MDCKKRKAKNARQNPTKSNKKMKNNLTSTQEKFVGFLLSGENLSVIAEKLEVDRSTLYAWLELETVEARHNELLTELKIDIASGLNNLYSKAIETLEKCLKSENEQVSLKTALYLLEKVNDLRPGHSDPRKIIKANTPCKELNLFFDQESDLAEKEFYKKRMAELNLV